MKSTDAPNIKSVACPTCYGPLSKDVLTEPVQCIYCDVWVATCDGRQQKLIVNRQQALDLQNGIQPSEPIFREGSPLDLLAGRIRRISPVLLSIPTVWTMMMHLYVGMGWLNVRAIFRDGIEVVYAVTFFMYILNGIMGYSTLSILLMFSAFLCAAAMLLDDLAQTDDVGFYMATESGIIALFEMGVPVILIAVWGMMQNAHSIKRHLSKIWAARFRFGITMTIGVVISFAFFSQPTKRQFLESKREEFTKQTDMFTKLCSTEWSAETPATESIVPQPKLELYSNVNGNVETILCSRALNQKWSPKYKEDDDFGMGTDLLYLLHDLHKRSTYYDRFLTNKDEMLINKALSAPYWLLYDPRCTDKSMTAKLYDAKTYMLLRKVKVPCVFDKIKDREALFDSLEKETGGVFTTPY